MKRPVLVAILCAACGGANEAPRRAVATSPPSAPAAPVPIKARWILATPQEADDVFTRAADDDARGRGVVALAHGDRGFLDHGRRFRVSRGSVAAVGADPEELDRVDPLPAAHGGGFLFRGRRAVYFGATFDGTLRLVAPLADGEVASLGHGTVSVAKGQVDAPTLASLSAALSAKGPQERFRGIKVYDLATGAPRPAPTGLTCVHPAGFSVLLELNLDALKRPDRGIEPPSQYGPARFSTDGKRYVALSIREPTRAHVDGDSIVVSTKFGAERVRIDGKVEPVADARLAETEMTKAARPVAAPTEASLPASLVEREWCVVPQRRGAYALAHQGVLYSYDLEAGKLSSRPLAGASRPAECLPVSNRKMLRAEGAKLLESLDGGETWAEVEPPPTGVPRQIGACRDTGCLAGPWVRLGWSG